MFAKCDCSLRPEDDNLVFIDPNRKKDDEQAIAAQTVQDASAQLTFLPLSQRLQVRVKPCLLNSILTEALLAEPQEQG